MGKYLRQNIEIVFIVGIKLLYMLVNLIYVFEGEFIFFQKPQNG